MKKQGSVHESAPPYPDPTMTYGDPPMPEPGMYTQPVLHPGAPPPPGYQEIPPQGMYPQPGYSAGPPPYVGYQGVPQPGVYPQPGYSPGSPHPAGHHGGVNFVPIQVAPLTIVTHMAGPGFLQDTPGQMECPHCQQTVLTNTFATPGFVTWMICLAMALFGCFFCCWIPFVVDSCQDVEHRCPTCRKVIYIYKRKLSFGRRAVVTHAYL